MARLLVAIVALVVVGLLVAVGVGLWRTPQADLNPGDRAGAVGYVDVSAEIPLMKSQSGCGPTTTTSGTWPFQTTTTTYECEISRGTFTLEVEEHLELPSSSVTVPAQLGLTAAVTMKAKVLLIATDSSGEELAEGWSNEKSFAAYQGEIVQFSWGHLYIDAPNQWVTFEYQIWVQGTDRYPTYEMIDSGESAFYFDGVNS